MASSGAIPYHLVLSGRKVRRRFLFWPGRPDIRVSVARTLLPPPAVVTSGEIGGLSTPCTFAENSTVRWTSEVSVLELEATAPRCLGPGSVSLRSVTAEEPEARERAAGARTRPRGPTIVSSAEQVSEPDIQEVSLAQRLAVVLSPPLATCLSGSGPLEWPGELHKFQKEGVAALVNRPVVLLADEMGLGRTIQAAAAMRILARRGEIERVLVVAPAGVLRNWRHELNRWAPELRVLEVSGPQNERRWKWKANVHVKLVSYETLRNDIALARGEGASILPWDLVCLDEAQRIKNWDSDISRAARSLWAPRRWAITGTPLENSLDDVRTILSFLEPSQAGYASAFAAGDREVRERLERLQLRRKKSDVLPDLPPKMETELYVELTPEQREDYQKLLTGGVIELRDKGESVSVADVLALITRLKQVCNFSFRTGSSSKLDDVAGRLRAISEEGHKALIFSQFTSEQYGVRKLADKLSEFRPHIYTGDMSLDDRRRAVDSFQADPESRVLILSLKAGGLGLNLQAASYVFHFDRWWNPATERQAEDRSHRIGQTRGVNVYKYVCSNTI
ncbi:MAG: DEAD/DEAH box helicase, partial [Armatimonadota bacterium]